MRLFLLSLLLTFWAAAQTFEVVSIKPHPPNERPVAGLIRPGGTSVVLNYASLGSLVALAYHIRLTDHITVPPWSRSVYWDIRAKSENPYTMEQLRMMVRNLLADRFKVTVARTQRNEECYRLVADQKGLRLKLSPSAEVQPLSSRRVTPRQVGVIPADPSETLRETASLPLDAIVDHIEAMVKREVVNATGLKDGVYDYSLEFIHHMGEGDSELDLSLTRRSFIDALRVQLGLRLEKFTGPVDTITITHADPPTEN